jgi:hypothetical protein
MPLSPISMSLGTSVLVEGKLLSGVALLEYAKQRGLCTKCVQYKTHKRIKKRLGLLRSDANWIPITIKDKEAGNYTVYKGYCLQPTCWTLAEAQTMLGETPTLRSKSTGRTREMSLSTERSISRLSGQSTVDFSSDTQSERSTRSSDVLNGVLCLKEKPKMTMSTSSRTVTPVRRFVETSQSTSSRALTPGRRWEQHDATNRRITDSGTRISSAREIEYNCSSPLSVASGCSSTHSSDISILSRQSSIASMASITIEYSSRRRVNMDIKLQESSKCASFYVLS